MSIQQKLHNVKPRCISLSGVPLFAFLFLVTISWQKLSTWSQDTLGSVPKRKPHVDDHLALHPDDTPWNQIKPSRTIVYHDCFDGLQCARLLLPLDWNRRESNEPEIAVAVIRRPAKVEVTDTRYGGAVIMNPGGPSASGVQALIERGERIQTIVDADSDPKINLRENTSDVRYFDIISFDPRGVNHTVPQLNCFPNTFNRLVWSLGADAEGLIGSSSTAFDQKWSRYLSRSATCMSRIEEYGSESIAYYMGTRSVVDDIIAIAERHGQWREAEVRKHYEGKWGSLQTLERERVLAKTEWRRDNERILFWGTSYGTVLGSALAAMYPSRLRRMVLDSVSSPQSFFNVSLDSLIHADKVLAQFTHLCHKHGPQKCKFYRRSEDAISQDIDTLVSRLQSTPLAVPASSYRGPDSITWTDMKRLMGESVYRPYEVFPILAEILHDLFNNNGSSFADHKATLKSVSVADAQDGLYNLSPRCKVDGPYSPACGRPNEWLEESLLGISCGDGGLSSNITKGQFKPYWYSVRNQSTTLGDIWTEWDLMCVGWNVKTRWKYNGPFSGETAHPILFVGNRLDPVCPIENAYMLALNFSGSAVLEQDTIGHGILHAQSDCTEKAIRAYFQSGELPASGTSCKVEQEPFEESSSSVTPQLGSFRSFQTYL